MKLVRHYLENIEGVEIIGVLGFVIFFLLFVILSIYTFRIKASSIEMWENMPVDENTGMATDKHPEDVN